MSMQRFEVHPIVGGVQIFLPDMDNKSLIFEGIEEIQMQAGIHAYNAGLKIQHAFPFLNADQREFLMTGITSEEWDELFGDDDES